MPDNLIGKGHWLHTVFTGFLMKFDKAIGPHRKFPDKYPRGHPRQHASEYPKEYPSFKPGHSNFRDALEPVPLTMIEVTKDILEAISIDGVELAALLEDVKIGRKIALELGFTGRVYVKEIRGNPHLILRGHPGKRAILNAPKYGLANPKIAHISVTPNQIFRSGLKGTVFQFFLYTAVRAIDEIFKDKDADLARFIGGTAGDVLKAAISTGFGAGVASIAAKAAGVGVAATGVVAMGPLVIGAAVMLIAGAALDAIDRHYGLTERLTARIRKEIEAANEKSKTIQREWEGWERWLELDPYGAMRAMFAR